MPKVTITFQEEGDTPIVVELPESVAAKMEKFIADEVTVDSSTGETRRIYSSKADLFMKHNIDTLVLPIERRYPNDDSETVKRLRQEIMERQQQIQAIKQAEILKIVSTKRG